MNEDIASAVATTRAQRTRQLENITLNELDAAMYEAATAPPFAEHLETTPTLAKRRVRRRALRMYVALRRATVQLSRLEGRA